MIASDSLRRPRFVVPIALLLIALGQATAAVAEEAATAGSEARTVIGPATAAPSPFPILIVYCVLIVAASFTGGLLPSRVTLTHTRMESIISLVSGLMLGVGVFHMFPHAVEKLDDVNLAAEWMMAGMLVMFFLLRLFHFHQHGAVEGQETTPGHDHDHDDGHACYSPGQSHGAHRLSWIGIAAGLALHTLIDGLALGASIQDGLSHGAVAGLFGVGTFLAIVLHKPLDAVSITSIMLAGGWSARATQLVNLAFSLMCPLGAGLFFLGVRHVVGDEGAFVGCALAFAAGVFLCISLGDLLPEIQFHSHNRLRLTILLLIGIAAAWCIGFLEPEHRHDPANDATTTVHASASSVR